MSDYHSNEYYHILEIPRKGGSALGAIAKKDIKMDYLIGTSILKEKPQIFDNGNFIRLGLQEWLKTGIPDWIKSVMASYNQMTKLDQDEFLKLNNNVRPTVNEALHDKLQTVIGQTFQVKY